MLIQGLNLFPLNRTHLQVGDGYYVSRDKNVYSTRRGSALVRMTGSAHVYGRVYQMGGLAFNTKEINDALEKVKAAFEAETAAPAAKTVAKVAKPAGRKPPSASILQATIAKRGWIIGSVDGESISLAAAPMTHETEASVNAELERLAKANPGKQFVALRFHAALTAGGLAWV